MSVVARHLIFFGWVLFMSLPNATAQSVSRDCDLEFDFEVEQPQGNQEGGKVYLIYRSGEGPFKIGIYDTMAGKQEFKEVKEINRFSRNTRVLVFENLEPSNYLIRIENKNCKRSLTGLEGITIK